MSRKEPSFNQLVDYMESGRADERFTIHHNLFGRSPDQVKEEFIQNARFLHRRAGGNYMYHEVISISRTDQIKLDEQKEKLRQITMEYIRDRARNNLAYGALHDDHDNNIHIHLIISANEVHSQSRFRLSKREFDQIKKSLEKRVLQHYPELQQKELINKSASEHLSNKGAELKRRTGRTPQRDAVREKVKTIFETAKTREELLAGFDKAGLDFYMRGKAPGVVDRETGRKHRIKSLGFIEPFNEINRKIESDLKRRARNEKKGSTQPASTASPSPTKKSSRTVKEKQANKQKSESVREEKSGQNRDTYSEQRSESTQTEQNCEHRPEQKMGAEELRDQQKREQMKQRRAASQQSKGKSNDHKR